MRRRAFTLTGEMINACEERDEIREGIAFVF